MTALAGRSLERRLENSLLALPGCDGRGSNEVMCSLSQRLWVSLLAVLVVFALLAAGCSDDIDPTVTGESTIGATVTSTTGETESQSTSQPETRQEPPSFQVTTAVDYVGQVLEEAPDGYWLAGVVAAESISQADRAQVMSMAGLPNLVVAGRKVQSDSAGSLGFPLRVTDALILETTDRDIWLGIQCAYPTNAVGEVVLWWEPDGGEPTVLRLWRYDLELDDLIEMDASAFVLGGCALPSRSPSND